MDEDEELRSFIYGSEQLISPISDDFITAFANLNSFKLLNLQYAESELHAYNITFYKSAIELFNFALAAPDSVYTTISMKPLGTAFQM